MKYIILLSLYLINAFVYYFKYKPTPRKTTIVEQKECTYGDWTPIGSCEVPQEHICSTGKGLQQFTKKVLTQSTGTLPRCDTQAKIEPCVDLSQCTLVPNWNNIEKDIVYPNSLMSYITSKEHNSIPSNNINTCVYHCDKEGANMAVISDKRIFSDNPDKTSVNDEETCTCWTLAGDINSVLKLDDNTEYVYDEDNLTYVKKSKDTHQRMIKSISVKQ